MNKKKLLLDILMTIILVVLMNIFITGVKLHEILGIVVFLLFSIHKALNFRFIKALSKNFFNKKVNLKTKIMYVVDCLLFVLVCFIIISGVLISESLFTMFNSNNKELWSSLHHFSSYVSLILISVHIGLHGELILNGFRKMFRIKGKSRLREVILTIISIAIMVMGLDSIRSRDVIDKFTAPFIKEENHHEYKNFKRKRNRDTEEQYETISFNSLSVESDNALEDYLSKLFCEGCSRRCPLTSLRCGRGQTYKQQAIENYNKDSNMVLSESKEDNNLFNSLGIMGLFICGTHYIVKYSNKEKMDD